MDALSADHLSHTRFRELSNSSKQARRHSGFSGSRVPPNARTREIFIFWTNRLTGLLEFIFLTLTKICERRQHRLWVILSSPTGRLTALNSPLALKGLLAHTPARTYALRLQRLMSVTANSGVWPPKSRPFYLR